MYDVFWVSLSINFIKRRPCVIVISRISPSYCVKTFFMAFSVEDLDDPKYFRLLLTVPYKNLAEFVFEYLKKKSVMTILFWSVCVVFLCLTISIRIRIGHYFHYSHILSHSVLGMIILPILIIPIHELLHIIPYYFSGARNIRIGMDLKQ